MTRILLIHPAADFSTKDVSIGIRAGLIAEGHEVKDYGLSRRLNESQLGIAAASGSTPEQVDPIQMVGRACEGIPYAAIHHRADWALFVNGAGLHPGALVALRQIGVRVAGWFTEAPYETDDDRELHHTRFVDLAFTNDRSSVPAFQAVLDQHGRDRGAVYLRHAFNPAIHTPPLEPLPDADRCDCLFIGSGFLERQYQFECVDWDGIDLRLGGLWWGLTRPHFLCDYVRWDGPLPNPDVARLYGGAKIILNPHRFHPNAESANPRVYEAAAIGAFCLSDYRAEIEDVFGDSIPMWMPGVPYQLGALVRRFLADPEQRQNRAAEAQRRVQSETFAHRARTIIQAMTDLDRDRGGSHAHDEPLMAATA